MYYFVINNFDVVNAVVGADIPKSTPGFATELAAMLLVTLFKYMAIALVTNITLYYLLLPVGLIMSFCGYAALYILKKINPHFK
jgi:hypothetical protein